MEYLIITENDLSIFMELVNHYIKNGWKLHGGVATTTEANQAIRYSQALVKEN